MASVRKPYVPRIGFPCFFFNRRVIGSKISGGLFKHFLPFSGEEGGGANPCQLMMFLHSELKIFHHFDPIGDIRRSEKMSI